MTGDKKDVRLGVNSLWIHSSAWTGPTCRLLHKTLMQTTNGDYRIRSKVCVSSWPRLWTRNAPLLLRKRFKSYRRVCIPHRLVTSCLVRPNNMSGTRMIKGDIVGRWAFPRRPFPGTFPPGHFLSYLKQDAASVIWKKKQWRRSDHRGRNSREELGGLQPHIMSCGYCCIPTPQNLKKFKKFDSTEGLHIMLLHSLSK